MTDMPTSPVNTREVEAVFGDGPSLAERAAPAPSMTAEWRRFAGFLRRPTLAVSEQTGEPWRVLARIYALDMLVMFALVSIAVVLEASGVDLPDNVLEDLEWTPWIVLLIVVGAPVFEELVFRGWLSGKPASFWPIVALGAGAVLFGLIGGEDVLIGLPFLLIGALGAGFGLIMLRERPAMGWFAKAFPVFFWLSTLAFALVHLSNYDEGMAAYVLPLLLPQFVLGMMLGYVRVRIGLWAAMALHAAHNTSLLVIAGSMALLVG